MQRRGEAAARYVAFVSGTSWEPVGRGRVRLEAGGSAVGPAAGRPPPTRPNATRCAGSRAAVADTAVEHFRQETAKAVGRIGQPLEHTGPLQSLRDRLTAIDIIHPARAARRNRRPRTQQPRAGKKRAIDRGPRSPAPSAQRARTQARAAGGGRGGYRLVRRCSATMVAIASKVSRARVTAWA